MFVCLLFLILQLCVVLATLEITHVSHTSGPSSGGNQIFILGQKAFFFFFFLPFFFSLKITNKLTNNPQ